MIFSEMTARGRPRAKRYANRRELKSAVLSQCRLEFRRFAGREWEDGAFAVRERDLDRPPPTSVEEEARGILASLEKAIKAVLRVTGKVDFLSSSQGSAIAFLKRFAETPLAELSKHLALESTRASLAGPRQGLAWFVWWWDNHDYLALPPTPEGELNRARERHPFQNILAHGYATGSRYLSDRELAIVSLLGGSFPGAKLRDGKAPTIAEVIGDQEDAIRTARKRNGRLQNVEKKARAGVTRRATRKQ